MLMPTGPTYVDIPVIRDDRGALAVIDFSEIDFPIHRTYFLYDVKAGARRGGHAHRQLTQLIVAPSGNFDVILHDGLTGESRFVMESPTVGLIVTPGYWREIENFTPGAVCLVFASHRFEESDYIRDFAHFVQWKRESIDSLL